MKLITLLKTPAQNNEQRILKFFLIGILPLMTLLTTVAFIDYQESKNEILTKVIRDQSANANKRLANFFDPIYRDMLFLQNQGNEGKLLPEKTEEMQDFLDDFGKYYLRDVKQVLFFDGQTTWIYSLNNPEQPTPATQTEPIHDLDKTLNATNTNDQIEWIAGDFYPQNGQSSVLAEAVFKNPKNKTNYSFGFYIDSTDFVKGLHKYMDDPQRLLLVSKNQQQTEPILFDFKEDGTPILTRTFNAPEIHAAMEAWKLNETGEVTRFTYQKQNWWGSFVKLQIKNRDFYSALLIPESEIIAAFRKGHLSLPLYASIVTAIALMATLFLWRRYKQELEMASRPPLLTEMADEELTNAINAGEGDQLEFKSTLRWNLRANKPGKEIEISALKTIVAFLNSEGGSLIIGIEDDGNILGIEADNFPNEDKFMLHFNNLIKQHIGLVASKFILFKTRPLRDKTILVVDCQKSDKPVFLNKDGDEHFYIRVGPGSRKLTFTETMDFIKKKR